MTKGAHASSSSSRISLAVIYFAIIALAYKVTPSEAKVFERCELAQQLHYRHGLDLQEVANWVCIAQHSSGFNSATYAGNPITGGSHGLFQISDVYWCSPPGNGVGCNIDCQRLRDDDIADDLACARIIHAEHSRISGDGYTAWNAYQQYCQFGAQAYIDGCFSTGKQNNQVITKQKETTVLSPIAFASNSINFITSKKPGKVYGRCELAQELYHKHKIPMEQIATWVCIAQHESNFDTSAVGRLNADGSADHGLFQISDLYWCTHDSFGGKGCNIPCHKLIDADLVDDIKCIRIIHDEHTRISGDGFTAWTVYNPHCRNQQYTQVASCFDKSAEVNTAIISQKTHTSGNNLLPHQFPTNPFLHKTFSKDDTHFAFLNNQLPQKSAAKAKVFKRCELAQELYHKHKFPLHDIPTWVCIAKHESNYDTSAVGRLNGDGSADHGLFQISDLYWCTHDSFGGKGCSIPCERLLDSDITDDIKCIRTIHDEHTRISGDGFTAWTVYERNCRNQKLQHISDCFDNNEVLKAQESIQNTNTVSNAITHVKKGKVYKECELAQELYYRHKLPLEDIPTWLCIAQHESNYDTAAVGRLNGDGSADHGLFQISDLYWCSHDSFGGKACNIPCNRLIDSDISDDVQCIKTIHAEHTRISGDGFTAWTVYNPHCRNQNLKRISGCFDEKEFKKNQATHIAHTTNDIPKGKGKIYSKCELAQELYFKHKFPLREIPTWVCIAQHESSFNTAAVGRLNTDGSADHGLFQISDLYWCAHNEHGGKACNIPCHKLLDNDLSDDVRCVKTIFAEHTRISGNGFTAWTVYNRNCRNQQLEQVTQCFDSNEISKAQQNEISSTSVNNYEVAGSSVSASNTSPGKGKVYSKCELAQELYFKHKISMKDIPTWVCIAQYESSFNTAAVGRLNTDGSADHGLFQISDLYWCSHDRQGGKACHISCNKLLDNDLTDDIRCIKIIHDEHTRISGDGFTAWTVYNRNCRNQKIEQISQCFDAKEIAKTQGVVTHSHSSTQHATNLIPTSQVKPVKRKIYKKCELAQELYFKHKLPMADIPTWVCIAQHESSFDTSAVGRLNTDGSADHGLFQISDLYWCSHERNGGKACNIACSKLIDADISDDVRCIKIIHEEHTRISGNGFTAWTVYNGHCRNQNLDHISSCFDSNEIEKAQKAAVSAQRQKQQSNAVVHNKAITKPKGPINHGFINNPFLNQFNATRIVQQNIIQMPERAVVIKTTQQNYNHNPFLHNFIGATPQKISQIRPKPSVSQKQTNEAQSNSKQRYVQNPFLQQFIKTDQIQHNKIQIATNIAHTSPDKKVITSTAASNNVKQSKDVYDQNTFLQKFNNPPSTTTVQHRISSTASRTEVTSNAQFSTSGTTVTPQQLPNINPFFNKVSTPVINKQQPVKATSTQSASSKFTTNAFATNIPVIATTTPKTTTVQYRQTQQPQRGSTISYRPTISPHATQFTTKSVAQSSQMTTKTTSPTQNSQIATRPYVSSNIFRTTHRPSTTRKVASQTTTKRSFTVTPQLTQGTSNIHSSTLKTTPKIIATQPTKSATTQYTIRKATFPVTSKSVTSSAAATTKRPTTKTVFITTTTKRPTTKTFTTTTTTKTTSSLKPTVNSATTRTFPNYNYQVVSTTTRRPTIATATTKRNLYYLGTAAPKPTTTQSTTWNWRDHTGTNKQQTTWNWKDHTTTTSKPITTTNTATSTSGTVTAAETTKPVQTTSTSTRTTKKAVTTTRPTTTIKSQSTTKNYGYINTLRTTTRKPTITTTHKQHVSSSTTKSTPSSIHAANAASFFLTGSKSTTLQTHAPVNAQDATHVKSTPKPTIWNLNNFNSNVGLQSSSVTAIKKENPQTNTNYISSHTSAINTGSTTTTKHIISTTKKPTTQWNWLHYKIDTTTKTPSVTTPITHNKYEPTTINVIHKPTTTTTTTTKQIINTSRANPTIKTTTASTETNQILNTKSTVNNIITTKKSLTQTIHTTTKSDKPQTNIASIKSHNINITPTTTNSAHLTIRNDALKTKALQGNTLNLAAAGHNTTSFQATIVSRESVEKYKADPFSHPFFAKYNEQFKLFTNKYIIPTTRMHNNTTSSSSFST